MASNDQNAARAANDGARLTKPQAAELLRQGSLLAKVTAPKLADKRQALLKRLNLSMHRAGELVSLATAGATPGLIAFAGFQKAADAAFIGIALWPRGEIKFVMSWLGPAEVLELYVPPGAGGVQVAYYATTTIHDEVVLHATCRFTKPIDIGLGSVEASRNVFPMTANWHKWGSPEVTAVRAQIDRMQAVGLHWSGGPL